MNSKSLLGIITLASFVAVSALTILYTGTDIPFAFNAYAQTDNDSGQVLKVNDLHSGFFTDANTRISHHVFEVGQTVKAQQRIDNNSTNSEQKGTLEFSFNGALSSDHFEHIETFDFDIKPYTYEIFGIEYTTKKNRFICN